MKITHKSMIHGRCPHGAWDYYDVIVEPREFLTTEAMESVLDEFRGAEIYQEALAQKLADRLKSSVTLRGRHGTVDTEVVAT